MNKIQSALVITQIVVKRSRT